MRKMPAMCVCVCVCTCVHVCVWMGVFCDLIATNHGHILSINNYYYENVDMCLWMSMFSDLITTITSIPGMNNEQKWLRNA